MLFLTDYRCTIRLLVTELTPDSGSSDLEVIDQICRLFESGKWYTGPDVAGVCVLKVESNGTCKPTHP